MDIILDKKKVLLFIKLPPPLTGAICINKYVNDSKLLNKKYNLKSIPISYKEYSTDLGFISLKKIFIFIILFFKLLYNLVFFNPNMVYFQISPLGIAFYRDLFYIMLIKLAGIRILYHLHGKGINEAANNSIRKKLYMFAFKNSSVICLSELLKIDIKKVYNQSPFVVNNGIPNTTKYSKKVLKKRIPIIVFLSNLFYSKGIIDLIEALDILARENIKYEAKLIGCEAELTENDLKELLDKKKLFDTVEYLGPIFNEKKTKILDSSDIFVHPTYEDVFPLNIIEAMRAGLPVISTFTGAIPEIVDDGITGSLVEKNNPNVLAETLKLLLKNEKIRTRMGEAGREKFLKKFTLEIFEENMKSVFDKVLTYN